MSSEAAQLLHSLWLSPALSKMLAHLCTQEKATTTDIRNATKLWRSEIHQGGCEGEERGWIRIETSRGRMGRPCKIYSLAVPFYRIIESLEAQKAGDARSTALKVEHLKELVA